MELGLNGSVALVTGSSRGLGRAAAASLAREGASVVINGRDEERLHQAAEEISTGEENDVFGVRADITEPSDITKLVEEVVERFGRLDHLVISGGGPPPKELLNTEDEDFYAAFDLLVMSAARLIRQSAEYLKRDGGGSVVINSATSVKEPFAWHVLASSVRIGAVGMQKSVIRELGPDVRVNSVLPGPHETERFRSLHKDLVEEGSFPSYEKAVEETKRDIPVDKIGDPDTFGDTVAFLCSDRASFINGVALPLDGGATRSVF